MRLPPSVLGRVRVGLGVGAVMLGGCDLVDEAKARVLGSPAAAAEASVDVDAEAAPEASAEVAPEAAPEPMLLDRGGVASVVQEVARSQSARPTPEPIEDLGRSRPFIDDLASPSREEHSSSFVPYEGSKGVIAKAPTTRPKKRPKRRPRRTSAVDEPCDPGLAAVTPPDGKWECLGCGRG